MVLYNRQLKRLVNKQEQGTESLLYLYKTFWGRILLKILINPYISNLYGKYKKSKYSVKAINNFIVENKIDMSRFEKKEYDSFNDFFTRKLKNTVQNSNKIDFISPCDGKLLVLDIKDGDKLTIKGAQYTITDLLNENIDYKKQGISKCLIFRLSLDDYHRYCFVDNCSILKTKNIEGKLHTVRSISSDYSVYKRNKRTWSLLKTENFGYIYQIEVGALFVGDIQNVGGKDFKKGEEKGYFNLGGSTIVLLINDSVCIDEDIVKQSRVGLETIVKYGEKIGVKK